ncbi:MAG: fatty acid desaturase [Myxococcota bacterium]
MTRPDPAKIAWVYGMVLPTIALGPVAAWQAPGWVAVSALLALSTVCLGHTVGLHRGIIHRSYQTSRLVRGALAFAFVLTGLGGPLSWYRTHFLRDHYQSLPQAPSHLRFDHGPWRDWALTHHVRPVVDDWSPFGLRDDDLGDHWLQWLERHWLLVQLAQAVLLTLVGGWRLLVIGGLARNAIVIVGHWFVGYVVHTRGTQRYRRAGASEQGYNHWLLGVLSLGEGFHNNHHAAPTCARIGRTWWEVDVGWWTIVALESLGLVWDVHRPRDLHDYLAEDATPTSPGPRSPGRRAAGLDASPWKCESDRRIEPGGRPNGGEGPRRGVPPEARPRARARDRGRRDDPGPDGGAALRRHPLR